MLESYCARHSLVIRVDWHKWLYGKKIPWVPKIESKLYDSGVHLAEQFLGNESSIASSTFFGFILPVKTVFLSRLLHANLGTVRRIMTRLSRHYRVSICATPELLLVWFCLCIRTRYIYKGLMSQIEKYLSSHGQVGKLVPLYAIMR